MHINASIRYNPGDWDYKNWDYKKRIGILQNILIIGANSGIARAVGRRYARDNCHIYLLARNEKALTEQVSDLRLRGATSADHSTLDVNNSEHYDTCFDAAWKALGHVDLVLICHGSLPEQETIAHDWSRILPELQTNALSTLALLCSLAPRFRQQGKGCIAVISSVAGDRGRQSNYIYGAAKSMVSRYLQGLRGELFPHGVHVMDIKPGFVDTPMTAHLEKGPLWTQPVRIADIIHRGVARKRNTLYAPGYWRIIMLIINSIPESLFKRLKL